MSTNNNTNLRYLSMFLGGVLLLAAPIASLSPDLTPPNQYNADKFIHAGYYCLLTFFWLFGIANLNWPRSLTVAIVIFLYSALLEILQQFIDARTASAMDILANGLGITLALFIKTALLTPESKTD